MKTTYVNKIVMCFGNTEQCVFSVIIILFDDTMKNKAQSYEGKEKIYIFKTCKNLVTEINLMQSNDRDDFLITGLSAIQHLEHIYCYFLLYIFLAFTVITSFFKEKHRLKK